MAFLKAFSGKKLIGLVLLSLVLLSVPFITHGTCGPVCGFMAAMVWGILAVFWIIGKIAVLLFTIAQFFINFIYSANLEILQFDPGTFAGQVISRGFDFTLSIANIGFVFAIILIAFATIFRNQTYGMKQMLWKLVVAAVLVNFSLLIAGTAIDFSHILTAGVFEKAQEKIAAVTGDPPPNVKISDGLGQLVNPAQLVEDIAPSWSAATKAADSKDPIGAMVGLITIAGFVDIFLWVITVVIIAIGVMLTVRYIYLAILLILMPLAWMFWVMPKYTHLSRSWWDKFFQQVFYLPAVMFFLSLGMATMGTITASRFTDTASIVRYSGVGDSVVRFVLDLLVLLGLLVGGLIAGQKLGGAGANLAMGVAGKLGVSARSGKWFGKKLGLGALSAGTGAVTGAIRTGQAIGGVPAERRVRVTGATETMRTGMRMSERAMSRLQGIAGKVGIKVPGADQLAGVAASIAAAGKKKSEGYQKSTYGDMRKVAFGDIIKGQVPAEDHKRMAVLAEAAKRGMTGDINEKHFTAFARSAKALGMEDEFKKAVPDQAHLVASQGDKMRIQEKIFENKRAAAREEGGKVDQKIGDVRTQMDTQHQEVEARRGQTLATYPPGEGEWRTITPGMEHRDTDKETSERFVVRGNPDGSRTVTSEGIDQAHFDDRVQAQATEIVGAKGRPGEVGVSKEEINDYLRGDAMPKLSNKEAAELSERTLKSEAVVSRMDIGQLKAIGRGGDDKKIAAVGATLKRLGDVLDKMRKGTATPAERERLVTLSKIQRDRLGQLVSLAQNNPVFVGERDFSGRGRSSRGGRREDKEDKDEGEGEGDTGDE